VRAQGQTRRKRGAAQAVLALLRRYESRNVTFIEPDGSWPMVWERARGVHVWDAEGRRYLDLTGAFGVAAAGHANRAVVQAGCRQMRRLLHAMGDVHPHALKGRLARELSRLTFERWSTAAFKKGPGPGPRPAGGKTIFCNSGFEAVEAALKTARLATGKPGVIAFEGAYHGLGYGALNATHRPLFRDPFRDQLREFGHFVPFPTAPEARSAAGRAGGPTVEEVTRVIERLLRGKPIGAVLVEPVQVRGGIHVPAPELLPRLRQLCAERGALLILDEIYTGFGRTGKWFACEHAGVAPDLVCLGKALTGGFPLSACVGRADLIDASWPASEGEAIHTSTFLGHPVGCAMALAQIAQLRELQLVPRSARLGEFLLQALEALRPARAGLRYAARGLGLLAGLDLRHRDGTAASGEALKVIKELLGAGYILLPEGEASNVISFTPPLIISKPQLRQAVAALAQALGRL
jgi:4-aminobutyrate aminotransferase-like enzyme